MNGAVKLADYTEGQVLVACAKCERRGRYRLAGLIDRFGADFGLPDLLRELSHNCPKWSGWDRCGAVYPELQRCWSKI